MTLFDYLNPINADLLYGRNNPKDVRLGEFVHTAESYYADANVVILGCPQDEGVQRNQGRVGASLAPTEIRKALYRLVQPETPYLSFFDAGDTIIQSSLEDTHTLHTDIVKQILDDGKKLIVLGGGNDLSYADCSGLAQLEKSLLAINVDAHFDVRDDPIRNSGTPYRQLLEEGIIQAENFYEVGNLPMSNSSAHRDYLLSKDATIVDLPTVYERGLKTIIHEILEHEAEAIFWGLDMDVVRAADAPGVSAINPIGISGYDFCQLGVIAAQDTRTRIFEITEVNPIYDIDSRTARLAAVTIHQFLSNLDLGK